MGELWDNVFSRSHHDNFCASKGHKNYNVTDCLQAKTFTKEVIIQHFLINLAIAFQASKLIDHPIDDILAKLQKRGCFLSWRVVLLCTRSSRLFSAAAAEHWETRIHEEFQQQERRNCRSWITELFHYLLRAGAIKYCCTFKNVCSAWKLKRWRWWRKAQGPCRHFKNLGSWILAHIVFIQIEHVDQNSISSCPNRHTQRRHAARSRSRME